MKKENRLKSDTDKDVKIGELKEGLDKLIVMIRLGGNSIPI